MKMKKVIIFVLIAILAVTAAGCSGGDEPPDPTPTPTPENPLTGDAREVLEAVLERAERTEGFSRPAPELNAITAENSEAALGLTAEQFAEYVADAYASTAESSAYEVAILNCADEDAAAQVMSLLAENYDSMKWGNGAAPEQQYMAPCWNYVLLVASTANDGLTVANGFFSMVRGAAGETVFF